MALKQTVLWATMNDSETTTMSIRIPVKNKRVLMQMAEEYKTSVNSLISAMVALDVQQYLGGEICMTSEVEASLVKEWNELEDELSEYFGEPIHDNGYEHRGYYIHDEAEGSLPKINSLIDRIERIKKATGMEK